jgi:hypothetical protein
MAGCTPYPISAFRCEACLFAQSTRHARPCGGHLANFAETRHPALPGTSGRPDRSLPAGGPRQAMGCVGAQRARWSCPRCADPPRKRRGGGRAGPAGASAQTAQQPRPKAPKTPNPVMAPGRGPHRPCFQRCTVLAARVPPPLRFRGGEVPSEHPPTCRSRQQPQHRHDHVNRSQDGVSRAI